MNDILTRIIRDKQPEIEELRKAHNLDSLIQSASKSPKPRPFRKALVRPERVTVIAELKKASPSKGVFREDFDVREIAAAYEKGKAAALSVLTEEFHFRGHRSYLAEVRGVTRLPILRKDFLVDPIQVPESRVLGADAILLIVAALPDERLAELLQLARNLHLDVLCEVHTEEEMVRALECGADLVGINNRDLRTFEVDLQTTFDLAPLVPDEVVLVSESGIRCCADLELMRDAGVSAVLVGETLIRQKDPAKALRNLYDPEVPVPDL